MSKRAKIGLALALFGFVYIIVFAGLSFINLVATASIDSRGKVFSTDGDRLFVGDAGQSESDPQLFFEVTRTIDGQKAYVGMQDRTLCVDAGSTPVYRPCNTTEYPIWSPIRNECYFIDSEKSDPHKMRFWKWTKHEGFKPISKFYKDLYRLSVSLDGKYLTAESYRSDNYLSNSVIVCSTDGKVSDELPYGSVNFHPVKIGPDDFLVSQDMPSTISSPWTTMGITYRWSSKTNKSEIFKIGAKTACDVVCVRGSVWVLFEETKFKIYPWMIARDKNRVTVAKLNPDLKTIEREIELLNSRR